MSKDPKPLPDIVFNNFQRGIADSAFLADGKLPGIATLAAADISSAPGMVRCGFAAAKQSGTVVASGELIQWIVRDPTTSNFYGLGSNGQLYKSTDGVTWSTIANTTTGGVGNGLGVFKDYLFIARNTKLDVMKIADNTITADWGSSFLTNSTWHPILWGQNDDILYIGNAHTVASVQQVAGQTFDPTNSATYSRNSTALTLPTTVFVKCLAELGTNLLVGVYGGTNYPIVASIYPWDRVHAAPGNPLIFSGDGVNAMITVGQVVYVLHGITGNISATNGINIFPLKKLRLSSNNTFTPYPGAICNMNGKPYFAFGSGSDVDLYPRGIYSLEPVNLYGQGTAALNCESVTSNNTNAACAIGALCPVDSYKYLVGWQNSATATQGVDMIAVSGNKATGYTTTFETQFLTVGGPLTKRKFDRILFQLAKALTTGQGIKISYRYNTNDSYTLIDTWDFATYGAISENVINSAFSGKETSNIQLKIQLTNNGDTATPDLMEVRLQGGMQ